MHGISWAQRLGSTADFRGAVARDAGTPSHHMTSRERQAGGQVRPRSQPSRPSWNCAFGLSDSCTVLTQSRFPRNQRKTRLRLVRNFAVSGNRVTDDDTPGGTWAPSAPHLRQSVRAAAPSAIRPPRPRSVRTETRTASVGFGKPSSGVRQTCDM